MIKKIYILLFLSIASRSSSVFAQGCSFNGLSLSNNQITTGYAYNNIDYGLSYNCQSRLTGYEIIKCQNGNLVGLSGGYYGNYSYNSCTNNPPKNCIFGSRFGQQITIPHFSGNLFPISNNQFYGLLGSYIFTGYFQEAVDNSQNCSFAPGGGNRSYNANIGFYYCNNGEVIDYLAVRDYYLDDQCVDGYDLNGDPIRMNHQKNCESSIKSQNGFHIAPYITCQNRIARDCRLGNSIIKHGESITTFDRGESRIGGACTNETRTCNDGQLSGSFTFLSCRSYNGTCGLSNGQFFIDSPTENLCASGLPGTINYNTSLKQWTRSCNGDGGINESCSAIWTGSISRGICNDFPNGAAFLSSTSNGLCKIGIANNFQSDNFGWTRRCTTSQGSSSTCEAKKAIFPTARIAYSTTSPTNNTVTAYILDIQPYGTFIQNNNSSTTKTFQTNGSYTFILKFDDKISYLTATVDRINTRPITLADLARDYQSKKCPQYKNNFIEKSNKYNLLDMQTMANTCLLSMTKKGSALTTNPKKTITRRELIEYSYIFARTIRSYSSASIAQTDIYTYKNLPKSSEFKEKIGRFGVIGGRKTINHKKSKNNTISVEWDKAASPKEVYETISYILSTHDDTIAHRQSLRQEEDRSKKKSISYADYAHLMRRLLEGYDRIPIGVNDTVIYDIYNRINTQSIEDQKKTISDISLALKKISPDTAEQQGLSIRRMLDDMNAIYNNTIPKRKGVTSISLQQVQQLAEKQTAPEKLFYRLDQTNKSEFLEMSY